MRPGERCSGQRNEEEQPQVARRRRRRQLRTRVAVAAAQHHVQGRDELVQQLLVRLCRIQLLTIVGKGLWRRARGGGACDGAIDGRRALHWLHSPLPPPGSRSARPHGGPRRCRPPPPRSLSQSRGPPSCAAAAGARRAAQWLMRTLERAALPRAAWAPHACNFAWQSCSRALPPIMDSLQGHGGPGAGQAKAAGSAGGAGAASRRQRARRLGSAPADGRRHSATCKAVAASDRDGDAHACPAEPAKILRPRMHPSAPHRSGPLRTRRPPRHTACARAASKPAAEPTSLQWTRVGWPQAPPNPV